MSFNAFHVIAPVVRLVACTPRITKLLNLTVFVPVFVKRIWKSAVFAVELNHSMSILIAEFIVKFNT